MTVRERDVMEKLQEISNYVGSMKIKKTFFGGYDREDVIIKMQEIVNMFQEYVMEEQEKQKKVIEDYELRMQTSQLLVGELNKKIANLSAEQKNAEVEKEQMKVAYKDYCSNILQQYSDSLKTLSAEFTQIMDNITKLQQNLIEGDLLDVVEVKEEKVLEVIKEEETEEGGV